MTNGLSHHYQLGESMSNFRRIRSIVSFVFVCFFDSIPVSKQYSARCDATLCGFSTGAIPVVYRCQINRTPGLYKLKVNFLKHYIITAMQFNSIL